MQQPTMPHATHVPQAPRKRSLNPLQVTVGVLLIAVAVLVTLVLIFMVMGSGVKGTDSVVKKDAYQAVFLNSQDGQVYFGKLASFNNQYYRLTDIYYVRVEQSIQPEGVNQQPQQNISLAKLGGELHGPEDEMFINRASVMFWENLKEDGQVVQAIRGYQKNPDAVNQQPQQQNDQTTNQIQQQNDN